jgi:hypothetical protein
MAPNLHQTRLSSLSNALVGPEILQHAKHAVTATAVQASRDVDSASYWEWQSEPNPALFSSTRMIELELQRQQQQEHDESQTIIADHDDYWTESRFAGEHHSEKQSQFKSATPTIPLTAPQYWDEATYAPSSNDAYWNW